jgi:hypothetical protein
MNKVVDFGALKSGMDENDFTGFSILTRLQSGEEIDNEDFTAFIIQAQEVIASLKRMMRMRF